MDSKDPFTNFTRILDNFRLGIAQCADWVLHVLPAQVERALDQTKASVAAGKLKEKYHCEVGTNALFRCSSAASHFEIFPLGSQREIPLTTTEQGLVVFVSGTF